MEINLKVQWTRYIITAKENNDVKGRRSEENRMNKIKMDRWS